MGVTGAVAIARMGLPLVLLLASGCTDADESRPQVVSDRGERICRERQADLPPGTTAMKARKIYVACLRSIDRELATRSAASSPDTAEEPVPLASAEQRYLHCRLRSQEIARAYEAYTRSTSLWAYADSVYPDDDPRYLAAHQAHRKAVADVEQLIPPAMRGSEPLFPDALNRFLRCEREGFR